MTAANRTDEDEPEFAWQSGLDGMRATLAELHVHRALKTVDPTAAHIGGNHAIRDHEIFDNTAWVNTKTAWAMSNPALVGFSPVNWRVARDGARPDRQLDAVALVMIGVEDLAFRAPSPTSLEIRWRCHGWWLVPASVLHRVSHPDGRSTARSVVRRSEVADYEVRGELTLPVLRAVIAANEVQTDTPP
jgi:hypothetical protein